MQTKGVHLPGEISIHAPRAGSDDWRGRIGRYALYFNPRSPCGERQKLFGITPSGKAFQSTLPVRGATGIGKSTLLDKIFQSTLPVRGATAALRCKGR